jgi:intracellular sulfur oxidation DsrE/DsrF family protein
MFSDDQKRIKRTMRTFAVAIALSLLISTSWAQKAHRVVIEVTGGGQFGFKGLLESVNNLRKALLPEPTTVEVVCRGEALNMLLSHNNEVMSLVQKEQKQGVIFAACGNTMHGRHIGPERLIKGVTIVVAGIAEAVLKQEQGWSYLRE